MERVPNESVEIPKNCSPVLGTSVPGELLIPVAASPASGEKRPLKHVISMASDMALM